MATARPLLQKSCHCLLHGRFTEQRDWQLWDLSLSLSGNIAVSGGNKNTAKTFIDVYSVRYSESSDKPTIFYSKEFEKYNTSRGGNKYCQRLVSFIQGNGDKMVTCIGEKLDVMKVSENKILRSCRMKGLATCVSVRDVEVFVGFQTSSKVTVYNAITLHVMKSITLAGFQPAESLKDMVVSEANFWVCSRNAKKERNEQFFLFDENTGKLLKTGSNAIKAWSVTSNAWLDVVAFVVSDAQVSQIEFYNMSGKLNLRFHIANIKPGVTRLRLSDKGDRVVTGNMQTGEVKIYDMATRLFTYNHLKARLASEISNEHCLRLFREFLGLVNFSSPQQSSANFIDLLLALETEGIIDPSMLDRLRTAFTSLKITSSCCDIIDFYEKTRTPSFYKTSIEDKNEEAARMLRASQERKRLLNVRQRREEDDIKQEVERAKRKEKETKMALQEAQKAHRVTMQIVQESTDARNKFKAELEECRLQLPELVRELQLSKRQLILSKNRLHQITQRRDIIKAEHQHCRLQHSMELPTSVDIAETGAPATASNDSFNILPGSARYLPETGLEAEFRKLLSDVSQDLTLDHCIFLATLFRLPAAVVDFLRNTSRSEIPGMRLLEILKERKIIHKYDISNLEKGLDYLHLDRVKENVILPYQRRIDLQREQNSLPNIVPMEHVYLGT